MHDVPKLACMVLALAAVPLAAVRGQAPQPSPQVVQTQSGPVKGAGADVVVFKGIPYAAPPTGDRRWRPPAPPAAWTTPRDASAFGPTGSSRTSSTKNAPTIVRSVASAGAVGGNSPIGSK